MKQSLFLVKDMETLRVMADSLRAQILEMLVREPLTARQLAAKLDLPTSKMYYHLGLLEKTGVIEVVETTQVGNLLEKIFRAVAENYDVDPALINFRTPEGQDNLARMVDDTLDAVRLDVHRSLEERMRELQNGAPEEDRKVMVVRAMTLATPEQARKLFSRLEALMQEFKDLEKGSLPDVPTRPYSLTLIFNPTINASDDEGGAGGIV